jgi:predicted DNA-binding transcriptional regulator AlpA
MPEREPLLTRTELAEYLGISPSTLAVWRYRRQGPVGVKVGNRLRYRLADVDAWIDANRGHIRDQGTVKASY